MNLSQIIATCDKGTDGILTELLFKYKRSLYTYYKAFYCCEPILMVTDVFNACQYGLVVPQNDFIEAVESYLDAAELDEETKEMERQNIYFNSIPLSKF